jgi:hypothetical protein
MYQQFANNGGSVVYCQGAVHKYFCVDCYRSVITLAVGATGKVVRKTALLTEKSCMNQKR